MAESRTDNSDNGVAGNLAWTLGVSAMNHLFPLAVYMHVSRVLGIGGVGLVGFIDSVTTYFILFSMMGIGTLGVRAVAEARGDSRKLADAFWSLLTLHGLFTLAVLVAMAVATAAVAELRAQWHLMCVGMGKLVFNVFLAEWLFIGLERFRFIALRTLWVKTAYVAAVFLLVRNPGDIFVYYFLTMLVVAAIAAIDMTFARVDLPPKGLALTLRRYVRPFFELGIYEITTSTFMLFCMVWLGFVSDDAEVGSFSTASKVLVMATELFVACAMVMSARSSRLLARGERYGFRTLLIRSVLAAALGGTAMGVLLYVFAPEAVDILSGPGYEGSIEPLRAMAVALPAVAVSRVVSRQLLVPQGLDRQTALASLAGFGTCVVICVLPESRNAVHASLAWIGAETVNLVLSFFLYRLARTES